MDFFKRKMSPFLVVITLAFACVGCAQESDNRDEPISDDISLQVTEDADVSTQKDDTAQADETTEENEATKEGEIANESNSEDVTTLAEQKESASNEEETTTSESVEKESATQKETNKSTEKETTTQKKAETKTEKQTTTQKKTETKTEKQTTTQKTTDSKTEQQTTINTSNLSTEEKMVKNILDGIIKPGMSEFDKAIAIHDWLTVNIDYDHTYRYYYIEETLTNKRGVCQGYALTYQMMAEMSGLEVTYVTGTATNSEGKTESHAWNQVKINGVWYNVDATWDDPGDENKDYNDHTSNRYDYFLVSDAKLEKDHQPKSSKQTCKSDYNVAAIYKYAAESGVYGNVAYADGQAGVSAAVKKYVEAGKSQFVLWYYDTTVTETTMWDVMNKLIANAPYPAELAPSYPPENGITKYVINITPLSEWNKIHAVHTAQEFGNYVNSSFDSGATKVVVRYEPTNGILDYNYLKYSISYIPKYYNAGKYCYMTITKKVE